MLKLYLIKIYIDGTDISGANCRHTKEAVAPPAAVDGALIVVEQTLEPSRYAGLHAKQLSYNDKTQRGLSKTI